MILANLAGISVFVTGGIGGVHRGAEKTMDVSADLIELGRTNVYVRRPERSPRRGGSETGLRFEEVPGRTGGYAESACS